MQNITVIGAGTMGNGIAHVFALAGATIHLVERDSNNLERGLAAIKKNLERQQTKGTITAEQTATAFGAINGVLQLSDVPANQDIVVEAASENIDVKKAIFRDADAHFAPPTILASNTSSISITQLASATQRPDRVIGMHFMNPVPVMKLVEVIRGYSTSNDTVAAVLAATEALGKNPIASQDYPGFVSNRILMPMINEAIQTLFEGVAGVDEIDNIMRMGMAHPMGPLHLADFIGLDICLNILNVLHAGFKQPRYAPCPLLVNMVAAGKLGAKTKEGFYIWGEDGKAASPTPLFANKRAGLL